MRHFQMLLLVFFLAAITSCQNAKEKAAKDRMSIKFEWSPTAGSAHLYPIETYRCDFIFADSSKIGPATREVSSDWGGDGGITAIGDALKPVPVSLDICWLSFTENKFYHGYFEMPYAKILQHFEDGFEDYTWTSDTERHLAHHSYDYINVGMAPGGMVVVWLNGSGLQKEVGRFQAKETTVDMADFLARNDIVKSKDAYVKEFLSRRKEVTDNLTKYGIPFGLWDNYRERYDFRPAVKFQQDVNFSDLSLEYFNGEKDHYVDQQIHKVSFAQKARVKEIRAVWTGTAAGKPRGYVLDIALDETEIFKAYQTVYGAAPNQTAELTVEVDKNNNDYHVFLQSHQQKIALLRQKGEIYYDNSTTEK